MVTEDRPIRNRTPSNSEYTTEWGYPPADTQPLLQGESRHGIKVTPLGCQDGRGHKVA